MVEDISTYSTEKNDTNTIFKPKTPSKPKKNLKSIKESILERLDYIDTAIDRKWYHETHQAVKDIREMLKEI